MGLGGVLGGEFAGCEESKGRLGGLSLKTKGGCFPLVVLGSFLSVNEFIGSPFQDILKKSIQPKSVQFCVRESSLTDSEGTEAKVVLFKTFQRFPSSEYLWEGGTLVGNPV